VGVAIRTADGGLDLANEQTPKAIVLVDAVRNPQANTPTGQSAA
jgi:hypothetical protein